MTPEGFEVPMGKCIENKEPTKNEFEKALNYDLHNPNAKNVKYDHYYNTR